MGSGLVGGAAAHGTLALSCGDELCLGGAVGGALVNIGVTPLAGGLTPFSATAPIAATEPDVAFGVGMALMPLTSALAFELTSHAKALRTVQTVQLEPREDGATIRLAGSF